MIVLDASVVVKWFSEEEHAEKALEIREKVRRGEERVMNILYVAPDVSVLHMGEFLKMMEEMKEINWQEEIMRVVEELVWNKNREKLLAEAKEIREDMKISVSSAELIREDRGAR